MKRSFVFYLICLSINSGLMGTENTVSSRQAAIRSMFEVAREQSKIFLAINQRSEHIQETLNGMPGLAEETTKKQVSDLVDNQLAELHVLKEAVGELVADSGTSVDLVHIALQHRPFIDPFPVMQAYIHFFNNDSCAQRFKTLQTPKFQAFPKSEAYSISHAVGIVSNYHKSIKNLLKEHQIDVESLKKEAAVLEEKDEKQQKVISAVLSGASSDNS